MSDKEEILKAISDISTQRGVTVDVHLQHHRYIDTLIKQAEKRSLFWEGIKKQVYGWGIIILLGAIGKAVWHTVIHLTKGT